jgi:hypothetical protein
MITERRSKASDAPSMITDRRSRASDKSSIILGDIQKHQISPQ